MDLPTDMNLLVALDVLLRERHVTRAAQRLGITQSAMSQRLTRLRVFLGDPILVPGRPTMHLTPRAEGVRAPIERALADLRSAVHVGSLFDPSTSVRRFVILGGDLVESYALPRLMPSLDTAPGVSISVERTDADFSGRLERGTADLAFVPFAMTPPSLRSFALAPVPFVVLMRRDHPAARGKLTLERYLAHPHILVAPRGNPGSLVDTALERRGLRRQVKLVVQHFTTAPFVLLRSNLLLTCPSGVADATAQELDLHVGPLPFHLPKDDVRLLWHERAHRDPAHVWLRRLITSTARRR